jgi:hypothetical protein
VQGLHRLGGTDRTLLWATAALIGFTLTAVAYGRSNAGPRTVVEGTQLCVNAAEVYSACLPDGAAWPSFSAAPSSPPATGVPSPVPSPSPSSSAAVVVPSPVPSPTRRTSTTSGAAPSRPPAYPAWQVGVTYRVGDVVTYRGRLYVCRQEHTSQSDWAPADTLALWLPVS